MTSKDEPPKTVAELNGFKTGDSVKVKSGIRDPDNDKIVIGGWCGRIREIAEDGIVLIEWDGIAIRSMDIKQIKEYEKEGFEWGEMHLRLDEVDKCVTRDNEDDASEEISKIRWQYFRREYF